MRSPKSTARRALPPIYVVVSDQDFPLCGTAWVERKEVARYINPGEGQRVVKYLPAPVPPRSRKGGGK